MTPRQAEAHRLRAEGLTVPQVAERMGVSERRAGQLLRRAREQEQPAGVAAAIAAAGVGEFARGGWVKTKGEDGTSYSVQFRLPQETADPDEWLDALRDGLADLRAAETPRAAAPETGRLAVFPVADLHVGLLTDPEETGEAWDIAAAMETFRGTFGELVDVTPAADVAVLAQLGDLLHADDQRSVTPQHGHHLDAAKFFRSLRAAVAVMKAAVEMLRAKHGRVVVVNRRGNHDLNAHYAVTLALAEYYRGAADVEVVEDAADIHVREHGRNLIVLHHGDRVRPDRLQQFVAAEYPDAWGRTRFRLALSGHIHTPEARKVGGLRCESIATIIPGDGYARGHAYASTRELVSITLDASRGEVSRNRVPVN